ncbi:MAG: hypothetical protein ABI846_02085 [Rudaea sp.]
MPTLVAATALLSGCGWMHRDKVEYYKGASETRPLEVPPDLDAPTSTKALVVPGSSAAAAASMPASAATTASPAMTPSPASLSADSTELHVADTVDSTWQRVGLALERAQLGKVTSKDEAARSYAFEFEGSVDAAAVPTEHHWYTRVLHPFGGDKSTSRAVKSALRINVSDDAGGARVSVGGGADDRAATAAARRVIEALRERLS